MTEVLAEDCNVLTSGKERVQEATSLVSLPLPLVCVSLCSLEWRGFLLVVGNVAAHHSGGQDRVVLNQLQFKKKEKNPYEHIGHMPPHPPPPLLHIRIVVQNLHQ